MPSISPAIAPTRARGGRVDNGDDTDLAEDCTAGSGRRVGEKIGRSLVALNEVRGIAHNELPRPIEPCNRVPLTGGSAVVGTLPLATRARTGFVTLRWSVRIPFAASSESVGACEAALTSPKAVISPTRMTRLAYKVVRDGITLHPATIQTRQAAPASVRPRPAALGSVPLTDR